MNHFSLVIAHRRLTAHSKLSKFTKTIAHYQSTISDFHFNFNRFASVCRKLKLLGQVEKTYFSRFAKKNLMMSQKLKCLLS